MTKEFWTITEVVEYFQIDEGFLSGLEEEQIVCPICSENPPAKLFPLSEMEKLRVAKILVEDMGVNLAGVEIILRMRQNMIDLRNQFDAILEDVARHLQETLKKDQ